MTKLELQSSKAVYDKSNLYLTTMRDYTISKQGNKAAGVSMLNTTINEQVVKMADLDKQIEAIK